MLKSFWKKLSAFYLFGSKKSFSAASNLALAFVCLLMVGCATSQPPANPRAFNFQKDTLAFANQLVWEYHYDDNGKWVSHARHPEPDYSHHCFVVARSAVQFFEQARFDPSLPVADAGTYRHLIHRVVATPPARVTPDAEKIVIPGYANLHEFSEAQTPLLKAQCGGAWQSYTQHGHWRMIMPMSRHHQEKMAAQLIADLRLNRPPVVHLVRFPHITINHAVVLFHATENDKSILFDTYDPNNPETPTVLTYDKATRTFTFPANDYYPGGRVDVYEVYRNWLY
jgi:hypothetical protein